MSAYIVFLLEKTVNTTEFELYKKKSATARGDYDITRLAYYGEHEVLEGDPIEASVIIRFPDMESAKSWYSSAAYQEALNHRLKAAICKVVLIQGSD